MAGGTYLPVDIGQPRNRKNKIELDAQAKFIITSNKNIDLLDCAEKIYVEDMVVADALEVEVLNTNTNQAAIHNYIRPVLQEIQKAVVHITCIGNEHN